MWRCLRQTKKFPAAKVLLFSEINIPGLIFLPEDLKLLPAIKQPAALINNLIWPFFLTLIFFGNGFSFLNYSIPEIFTRTFTGLDCTNS